MMRQAGADYDFLQQGFAQPMGQGDAAVVVPQGLAQGPLLLL